MKADKKYGRINKANPLILSLESADEVNRVYALLNHSVASTVGLEGAFTHLKPWRNEEKCFRLHSKINKFLKKNKELW